MGNTHGSKFEMQGCLVKRGCGNGVSEVRSENLDDRFEFVDLINGGVWREGVGKRIVVEV